MADKAVNILVVDDNEVVRETTRRALALLRPGWRVWSCADGSSTMAVVRRERLDIALVDVVLPDVSGLDLCHQIKAAQGIPVLLFSGAAWEARQKARGLDNGADDYLNKPLSPVEVVARIDAILRRTAVHSGQRARL